MQEYGLIINGERLLTEQHFEVINPATEVCVSLCPDAAPEHLDLAVAAAQEAFTSWSNEQDSTRKAKIHEIADAIEAHAEELARLLTLEQGKPLGGTGSRFELAGCVAWARATAELDLPVKVIEDTPDTRIEQHRRPLGVVGSITPWNWPLMIAIWHIIPAIRTGNTVVLKPSSMTPLSTLRMGEIIAGILPPGVLNVITGGGKLGSLLTAHPGVRKIVFTGSTPTGKRIMQSAATTLKRLTLELGGNDAAIVLPDVDPKIAAPKIFGGAFINSGQTCGALKRLYVHADIYDAMCDELCAVARSATLGNGLDEGVDYGPVQNRAQFDFVSELVEDAKQAGARILTGGAPMPGAGFFYPITLVADISDGTRLVDEEPFGPVLPIIKYTDIDDAIARANRSPYGLNGSVWSNDIERACQLAARLECGTALVNKHGHIQPNVPFGGVKESGFGVEFAREGLEEFTSIQVINIDKQL